MHALAIQTIALAAFLGVLSYTLARTLRIPAILFYLISGIVFGPLGLKIINATGLGNGLLVFVEIVVAIILFEGGLSLSGRHFRQSGTAIRRILFVSLPLTGLGAALLGYFILHFSLPYSFFFGALIIVTGPTVIGSLLKTVPLNPLLNNLFHWESIWGDVGGILLSALALEFVVPAGQGAMSNHAVTFAIRIGVGIAGGIACGYLLGKLVLPLVARLHDPTLPGIVSVAFALGTFATSNYFAEASGPLAVAVAGFTLSRFNPEYLYEIRHFKEQLSVILIGTLFILLSAFINPLQIRPYWPRMILVALLLGAIVRPISVCLGLSWTSVPWRDRLYMGFIGPRGIIALATVAYASLLVGTDNPTMNILTILTFVIIFFSGFFATVASRPLASILGVSITETQLGVLIIGVNPFSIEMANFISQYIPVSFVDTNPSACEVIESKGHISVCADILDGDVYEEAIEQGLGRLLVMTTDEALNQLIAETAATHLGSPHVYRAKARRAEQSVSLTRESDPLLAFKTDFYITDALSALDLGQGSFKILSADHVKGNGIVPLLEIANGGKGLRILRPKDKPEGEVFCFLDMRRASQ